MTICPGIYDLAEMKDGRLARLRLPGGCLPSDQAVLIAKLAEAHGNGEIDLTNRANLQLRGINEATQPALIEALLKHNLVASDAEHDRRRNITIDPLSGLPLRSGSELVDCTIFAKGLDALLKTPLLKQKLSPKFSFVLDGGGTTRIAALPHDLALIARPGKTSTAEPRYQLILKGKAMPFYLDEAALLGSLEMILKKLITLAAPAPLRMKTLLQTHTHAALIEELAGILPPEWRDDKAAEATDEAPQSLNQPRTPVELQDGRYIIPLIAPTGRLRAAQLEGLAELNRKYASGPLRLTPWQGLLLTGVREADISALWPRAEALGLLTQQAEQNLTILSCAGAKGCIHGQFETKLKALELRETLAENAAPAPLTIHLSACEKGCASRDKSDFLILGHREKSGLTLHRNAAPSTSEPGKAVTEATMITELKKLI